MNNRCEDIVAAFATGGPYRRWRARRHALRCPQCASTIRELRLTAELLADFAPLTAAQRQRWVAAAEDECATAPVWAWWFRPALTAALASVVVGAAGLWWAFRPRHQQQGPPAIVHVEPSVPKHETARDVEDLRRRVVDLAHELDELRERAELLDARKDVADLMARLTPKSESTGL